VLGNKFIVNVKLWDDGFYSFTGGFRIKLELDHKFAKFVDLSSTCKSLIKSLAENFIC